MFRILTKYPPVIMMGGIFCLWLWSSVFDSTSSGVFKALAIAIIIAAALLTAWSFYVFRTHKTPILPDRTAQNLITNGPFAVSRNPLYLAMALVILAAGCWFGTWIAFPITFLFCWIVTQTHIKPEESMLRETFPDQAAAYLQSTPRWIGPL